MLNRQAHQKARTKRLRGDISISRADVFGSDDAAVGLNDLLGDCQAQTRFIAELLFEAFRIKAFEHFAQRLIRNAGAYVFDNDQHAIITAANPNADGIAH